MFFFNSSFVALPPNDKKSFETKSPNRRSNLAFKRLVTPRINIRRRKRLMAEGHTSGLKIERAGNIGLGVAGRSLL